MRIKTFLTMSAVAVFSFTALADDGHGNNNNNNNNGSFQSSVIGSMVGLGIGGVNSAGAPWVVQQGDASVSADGRIRVQVQGLLLGPGAPANLVGTTATVTMVAATLVCGGTGGIAVAVSDSGLMPAPLDSRGNAQIDQTVTLPAVCFGPVVLVRIFNPTAAPGAQVGPFIAATGMMPNAAQNQNQDGDNHGGSGHGI